VFRNEGKFFKDVADRRAGISKSFAARGLAIRDLTTMER